MHDSQLFYLIRHGDAAGAAGRCIGRTDLPLSSKGIGQAEQAAAYCARRSTAHIVSSPLQRTLHTATIMQTQCACPLTIEKQFTEIAMGPWDGLPFSTIKTQWPETYQQRGQHFATFRIPPDHTQPNAPTDTTVSESFSDVAKRAWPALQQLTRLQGNIAVVTHAGVIRTCLCHLLQQSLQTLFQFNLPTGSITTVEYQHATWRVHDIGTLP